MLSSVHIRPKQLALLAEYLEQFKEEVKPRRRQSQWHKKRSPAIRRLRKPQRQTPIAAVQIPAPKVDPIAVELGKKIYQDKNCKMCHKLNKIGGTIGPKLDKVGARRDAEWFFHHFKDPQSISPGSRMPNYNFSNDDADALTAYMLTLQ